MLLNSLAVSSKSTGRGKATLSLRPLFRVKRPSWTHLVPAHDRGTGEHTRCCKVSKGSVQGQTVPWCLTSVSSFFRSMPQMLGMLAALVLIFSV